MNTHTDRHTDGQFWLIESIGPEGLCFEKDNYYDFDVIEYFSLLSLLFERDDLHQNLFKEMLSEGGKLVYIYTYIVLKLIKKKKYFETKLKYVKPNST